MPFVENQEFSTPFGERCVLAKEHGLLDYIAIRLSHAKKMQEEKKERNIKE